MNMLILHRVGTLVVRYVYIVCSCWYGLYVKARIRDDDMPYAHVVIAVEV